jgi:SAM-dependent methyltransferase
MTRPSWDESYASGGFAPWDSGTPDPLLVDFVEKGRISPCRTFEPGCGTGTNSIWLAERGFDVLGVDVASLAIERARGKLSGRSLKCRFEHTDFLAANLAEGPFDFAFDRGCFHVFDEAEERARFAERVAGLLSVGGLWLSLIGSTEGGPRDVGPPRRSAHDIVVALEPHLEIVELRADTFRDLPPPMTASLWWCLARRRAAPAVPSSRH